MTNVYVTKKPMLNLLLERNVVLTHQMHLACNLKPLFMTITVTNVYMTKKANVKPFE
jgi:hypothetical protein